jgi:predicted nucleic acid-binding protein
MAGILDRVPPGATIGLDTAPFIYHLEGHPQYSHQTGEIFSKIEQGYWRGVTSVITLLELTVLPLRLGREQVARKYEALLVNFPHLAIVDIDRNITRSAAKLRAEYNIRPADALQVAACKRHGARVFLTNDRRLLCCEKELKILLLDELGN